MGWALVRVFRVVRVPWVETRITHNNFGYRELKPELVFGFFGLGFFGFGLGFFGLGFRVSGFLPSHTGGWRRLQDLPVFSVYTTVNKSRIITGLVLL